ncbi:DUF4259 domain-containing protein [Chondromyces crocatus]|nr:DUF4259 domain-containing protein [Chondromyces crocatus]
MGAWGHRSFENDSALDWLLDLGSESDLRAALEAVAEADANEYIDVDDASTALAAAEIVAAGYGKGLERLNNDARAWLASYPRALAQDLVPLAHRAVTRVLTSSELKSLREPGQEPQDNPWRANLGELLARLAPSEDDD